MQSKYFQRITNEINELNESPSLRTIMIPSPDDKLGEYYFTMIPNDGPMCKLHIVGRMIIGEDYPNSPPVVHVFTDTERYNVDVYKCYREHRSHSSLCFDILTNKQSGGSWNPEYTISCLMASLMSAIVSYYVEQAYGSPQVEAVTMEKLKKLKSNSITSYNKYKKLVPHLLDYEKILSKEIKSNHFQFNINSYISNKNNNPLSIKSKPFKLNDTLTITFNLDDLKTNQDTVFSLVVTNNPNDLVGKKNNTILIRDGVTATAAIKKFGESTKWFYHGIPMNEDINIINITLALNQLTLSYKDKETNEMYIYGDSPLSQLHTNTLGKIDDDFYLVLFLKNKNCGKQVNVKLIEDNKGYIHVNDNNKDLISDLENLKIKDNRVPPIYVSLELDKKSANMLNNKLKATLKQSYNDYPTNKNTYGSPGHVTIAFYKDFENVEVYKKFINKNYIVGSLVNFDVLGYVIDKYCVAFIVELHDSINIYPKNKNPHITALLKDKPPKYSNTLINEVYANNSEELIMFDKPIKVKSTVHFQDGLRVPKKGW